MTQFSTLSTTTGPSPRTLKLLRRLARKYQQPPKEPRITLIRIGKQILPLGEC